MTGVSIKTNRGSKKQQKKGEKSVWEGIESERIFKLGRKKNPN